MVRGEAVVDYERFRSAEVVIFIDSGNIAKSYRLLVEHGPTIERLAATFSARVLFAQADRLLADAIVESEFADAWLVLVADGRSRALATKKDPQRINVDSGVDWESHGFKEILRQIRESTRILEDVTAYYSRYSAQPEPPGPSLSVPVN